MTDSPPTITLFGHDTSPYVRRIRVLLAELGVPFQRDARSWNVPDAEVLRINPMLRVPALVDTASGKAQPVLDSRLIANYLYDRYQPGAATLSAGGALPLQRTLFSTAERWNDENALSIIDAAADSLINVFLLDLDGIPREKAPYLQRQMERAGRCLSWLDERLAGRETFHPGAFGFLDIGLTCHLDWMIFRDRYPVSQHPNLMAFLERHKDRPSLDATHPRRADSAALPRTKPQPAPQ